MRAELPLVPERLAALGARPPEPSPAHGADQIARLHLRAAVGAARALGPHNQVYRQRYHIAQQRQSAPQCRMRAAPARIGEHPQRDEQYQRDCADAHAQVDVPTLSALMLVARRGLGQTRVEHTIQKHYAVAVPVGVGQHKALVARLIDVAVLPLYVAPYAA